MSDNNYDKTAKIRFLLQVILLEVQSSWTRYFNYRQTVETF